MRNPFRLMFGFAMAAILGLSMIVPVAAQDDEVDDLDDVPGLQRAVGRYYSVDFEAMMSTPGAMDEEAMSGLYYLTAGVFEFDGDDSADAGLDQLYTEIQEEIVDDDEMSGFEIQESEVEDLGDEAKSLTAVGEEDGEMAHYSVLFIRDGQYLYYLVGVGGSEDPSPMVLATGEEMLDRDAGDGDGTFNEDGTSTGGLWDLLPSGGDQVLGGLAQVGDEIIFPEDDTDDED